MRSRNHNQQLVAREIMIPFNRLITLRPDMDALSAIRMLLNHRISGAPVIDNDGTYLGVFSEKTSMDFLLHLTYEDLPSSQVRAFMNTDPDRTIRDDTDLLSIMDIFLRTPYRRLPVLDSDFTLVGQISRRDTLGAATKSLERSQAGQKQILYLSAFGEAVTSRFA